MQVMIKDHRLIVVVDPGDEIDKGVTYDGSSSVVFNKTLAAHEAKKVATTKIARKRLKNASKS